jgi:hypothetical protein
MSQSTKVPEHKLRQQGCSANLSAAGSSRTNPSPKGSLWPAPAWPFSMEDGTPLSWWRLLPPDLMRGSEHLVRNTLNAVTMLHGGDDLGSALRGDAAAAIGVALAVMPINGINLQVDIAMTTLLSAALKPNSSPALVMAQVIGLTDLDHPFGAALASSWLDFGRRHSTDPQKFSEAEAVLRAAFRERRDDNVLHPDSAGPGGEQFTR